MASATIETFCCISSDVEPGVLSKLHFSSHPYNIVCSVSSLFGIFGALYQVLPTGRRTTLTYRDVGCRQRTIINWLAVADLLASLGILLRSIFWLVSGSLVKKTSDDDSSGNIVLCSFFSVWVRFFFTATYLWTLCYAVDVYLVSKQKSGSTFHYHLFTWSISGALTVIGLGTLYLPNAECHSGLWRVLPNYLLSYIPIVVVMVFNPLLYYLASKQLRILLSGCMGQLSSLEQSLLSALKERFFFIVLVFYVCWMPNVLNGIVLWGFWNDMPRSFVIGVWYAMAFVNPLQAVLNSAVYKGWGDCRETFALLCCRRRRNKSTLFILEESSDYHLTSADDCSTATYKEIQ